jgi:hypothetical protein
VLTIFHRLMALLEICNIQEVECSKLVICVDRHLETEDSNGLLRDLGWVGFEAITFEEWTNNPRVVSDQWMLLSMDT